MPKEKAGLISAFLFSVLATASIFFVVGAVFGSFAAGIAAFTETVSASDSFWSITDAFSIAGVIVGAVSGIIQEGIVQEWWGNPS